MPFEHKRTIYIILSLLATARAESPDEPAREMLLSHYHAVEAGYRQTLQELHWSANLGITLAALSTGLDHLEEALEHWTIEFQGGNAALAVHAPQQRLAVNPQSMQSILEDQDDFSLLHESVHLTTAQEKRQLYGLYHELLFADWLVNHFDEKRTRDYEKKVGHVLGLEDLLGQQLWSPALRTDEAAREAASSAVRESWICEIQAYQVQLMAIDHAMQKTQGRSLHQRLSVIRKMLALETAPAASAEVEERPELLGDEDVGLAVFQSFRSQRVTDAFQKAVLACVLLNPHNALVFQAIAWSQGWNLERAGTNAAYRDQLFEWARRTILRWEDLPQESDELSSDALQRLRREGLLAGPHS